MPCCRFERLSLRASVRAFVAAHTFVYPGIFFLAVGLLAWLSVEATVVAVALYALTFNGAERTGSRRSIAFMRSFLECHAYFPVVTKMWDGTAYTSEPNEGHFRVFDVERKQFVFGLHPHGPIPLGASVLLPQLTRWERIVQRLRVGVASAVFWAPIIRDFYLGFGCVDASLPVVTSVLQGGDSLMLLPGGIREQLIHCGAHEEAVVLRDRKGFVRLALKHGAALVPVFCFGERRGYKLSSALAWITRLLRKLFHAGVPMLRGRWFTLMPWPVPVTLVVGRPLEVPHWADPDTWTTSAFHEAVDEAHAKYIEALQQLYDEHKDAAGYRDVHLRIL